MPDRRQLSEIPSVDEVLRSDGLSELIRIHSRTLVTKAVRYILEEMRQGLIDGQNLDVSIFNIETKVRSYIVEMLKQSLKKVVNPSAQYCTQILEGRYCATGLLRQLNLLLLILLILSLI